MKDSVKNYLGWTLILGVLVLAFAGLSYVSAYRHSLPAMETFGVSGEGKVVIVPDVAQFSFSVVTEGGLDIAKLQTENTNKVNQAIAYLKGQGIDKQDIQTAAYNLSPRYQSCYRPGSTVTNCAPTIIGYSINQSVSVKIRDFDLIGELLTGVTESGANSVSGLNFTIDNPETARAGARAKAIDQAQTKAKSIAKAAGFHLGRLVSIEEGGYYPYAAKNYAMGMGGDIATVEATPAPAIEPGSEEVTVNVNLRYEIK